MALIVNSKTLPLNPTKGHELEEYSKEYQEKLKELQIRFPSGSIALKRNGYPKVNRDRDGSINLPEIAPPMFIPMIKNVDGVSWAYCKTRPKIEPNGLVSLLPDEASEMINSEVYTLDLRRRPDHAFYIMYKSGILGTEFQVHDPEGDRITELLEKNKRLKVEYTIRDMEEEKLRMLAQAWGVKDVAKKPFVIVQDDLSQLVFKLEDEKRKNITDLSAKGMDEFLAEARNDEVVRPRAIVQMGIDEKRIVFQPKGSKYYFDGGELCFVPPGSQKDRQEYLNKFLTKEENKEKWLTVLQGLLSAEYIESMDKFGVRWLTMQFGDPVNKKEEELRKALLERFAVR